MQIWKPIVGYEGLYEVSSEGRIRSVPRLDSRKHVRGGSEMNPRVCRGYLYIGLRKDGKKSFRRLHRIVLEAFVGPCPEGLEGCHGPNGRMDNSLGNLRWDTHEANVSDRVLSGLNRGENNKGGGKLTEEKVREIKAMLNEGHLRASIAKKFEIGVCMVGRIARGISWSHVDV